MTSGDQLHIKVSRDGFQTMERTIENPRLLVRVFLPKTPDWEYKTPGIVMSRAQARRMGDLIFVTDRSGVVTALDLSGAKAWQVATG